MRNLQIKIVSFPDQEKLLKEVDICRVIFISIRKFGIRLGYDFYKNKLRLNLCLPCAYTNQNLKYNFKDSYSEILYYLNARFFNENFVHIRKH